jgi:hypothetical protein
VKGDRPRGEENVTPRHRRLFASAALVRLSGEHAIFNTSINRMLSHINSYSREKLGGKSPVELFNFLYGQGLAQKLGQTKIPPNEILLKPALLKK